MTLTDALLGEHGVFYAQFAHLERTLPEVEDLGQVQVQGAMLASALASHARLENELLFDALVPHIGAEGGPVAVMRAEHDQIEGGLSRLPGLADQEEARNLLLEVLRVARDHFAKEEQILYPMAQRALGREGLTQLGSQWAQSRAVTV